MTHIEEFKQNLIAMRDKLEPLLKKDTDKFIQIAANYVEQNQGLLEKNRASLYNSIIRSAQQGLYLDGHEAALVPFNGEVKFMSMYKGLLKQVRNSGELASINCGVVYENDTFEFFVDEIGEHIKHVPNYKEKRGKHSATYAIARTKDSNAPYIEIMREEEIQDCKKASRARSNSPWDGPFSDEMRKKTVLRRISKRLPMSTDLNAALHADDDLFIPEDDPKDDPKPETSGKLRDAVSNKQNEPEPAKKPLAVQGVIEELKIIPVTVDGNPSSRFACRIGNVWFGTFDQNFYEQMGSYADKKSSIWMVFEKRTNKSGKEYNEALEINEIESTTVDETEVPI